MGSCPTWRGLCMQMRRGDTWPGKPVHPGPPCGQLTQEPSSLKEELDLGRRLSGNAFLALSSLGRGLGADSWARAF